ncbi:MAG TPA: ATP-binding cassette domain-containing protein [Patescibacteria group bacterium]|nr:ATP-binding cassette domain-containing protein [Patescibacteria group bacterium]
MEEKILKVENLSVNFNKHEILAGICFEVERDKTVAVIGANGSGKTVLFKSLLDLIQYSGKIEWAQDAKIGYVPQKLSVSPDLPITVLEFLKLKENDDKKIKVILESVGFKEKAEHIHHDVRVLKTQMGSLSGGELQRILIAYALLGQPNVLLLDEPTAGVDIEGEETFYNLFERLKKDKDLTIMFISHDSEIVKKYADMVIELKHDH